MRRMRKSIWRDFARSLVLVYWFWFQYIRYNYFVHYTETGNINIDDAYEVARSLEL